MIVYHGNKLIESCHTSFAINDRGLLLGDGVFTTIYYNGHDFECFEAHCKRLTESLTLFQIPKNICPLELRDICYQILQANSLETQTAALRVTITRGPGERGLKAPKHEDVTPSFLVTATPYQRNSTALTVQASRFQWTAKPPLSRIKHLGYQLSILGRLEADSGGVDDVIFFNSDDQLVCTTCANVFVKIENIWYTPPLSSGAFPGIMRSRVLQGFYPELGKIKVTPLSRDEIFNKAESLMATNCLIGIKKLILPDPHQRLS